PPRECPPHPACSSAASTRDRRAHLCERSLLASIITPDFSARFLIGEREPTRAGRCRQICSEKGPKDPYSPHKRAISAEGRASISQRWARGLAAVAFSVISRRRAVAPPPRARVHHSTIGEAIKIEEEVPTIPPIM